MWENGKSQLRGESGRLVGQPWRKGAEEEGRLEEGGEESSEGSSPL